MDSEVAKTNTRQFFDYVNGRDTESMKKWIDEFIAEEFVNHSPSLPNIPNDKEGFKETFSKLLEIFPEMKINIKEMVFENDILCFRLIMQGFGTPDVIKGIAMVKYKNDKIVDRWANTDSKQ